MAWAILVVAGLCEIAWAVGLKYTDGFTRPAPTALVVAAMVASVWLLAIALRTIPVGTAIVGMLLFDESRDALRIVCILLIVAGIVGLKLVTPEA